MSSVILILVIACIQFAIAAIVVACLRAERQRVVAHASRIQHELAMDAAVFLAKRIAPEAAVAWVRTHVDPVASDALARQLGGGYERYLHELHRRFTGG